MACIIEAFSRVYRELVNVGLIKLEYILIYDLASEVGLHSILQFTLIKAGVDCGYITIPEYKVRLRIPIDKFSLDERYVKMGRKPRRQWRIRVDVAFLRNSTLTGVGEIYTLDEIHGCLPSKKHSGPRITPYHKLRALLSNFKPEFLVVVNVMPQNPIRLPYWGDVRGKIVMN